MKKKLTLSIDEHIIKKAEQFAKNRNTNLSKLVEDYLFSLTQEHCNLEGISPKLMKIAGSVKVPADFDEKTELAAYYKNKYDL